MYCKTPRARRVPARFFSPMRDPHRSAAPSTFPPWINHYIDRNRSLPTQLPTSYCGACACARRRRPDHCRRVGAQPGMELAADELRRTMVAVVSRLWPPSPPQPKRRLISFRPDGSYQTPRRQPPKSL
ncbi:hypothetical protein ACP4OV_007603 [Aristida adscensionis]